MYKTNLTVGEILNALKNSPPGPVWVCLHGKGRVYDTLGVFTLGGGLFVELAHKDEVLAQRQSIEDAISMLENQPPETKIIFGIDEELSQYFEIDQTTKVDLNLDITLFDYNVTLYDEKRGLDLTFCKPDKKIGYVFVEHIVSGFIYFHALFT